MHPILVQIGTYQIHVITIFFVVFAFVYLASFWWQTRHLLKNNALFDIAFLTLLASFVVARLLGVILNFNSYLAKGWSILPLSDSEGGIKFLATLPWSIAKISDGNFVYIGFLLGLIIGLLIIYRNSNRTKSLYVLFDKAVVSFAMANVLLLFGFILEGTDKATAQGVSFKYADGSFGFPLQLIGIGFNLIFIVVVLILQKVRPQVKQGLISSSYFILYALLQLILQFFIVGYQSNLGPFDFQQVVGLCVAAIGVFLIAGNFIHMPKREHRDDEEFVPRAQRRPALTDIERIRQRESYSPRRFSLSFSDRGASFDKSRGDQK